jgi:lysyl-tRNA synthetase class 2
MQDPPYRFDTTDHAADVGARFDDLEAGGGSGETVAVAGRIMLARDHGRLAFLVLRDRTGDIQLFARDGATPDFSEAANLPIGTYVGVRGEVVRTKKGQLSISLDEWEVLARPQRSFPDKWHGLADPDTRYRQRYVDLWVTPEARETMLLRSRLLSLTRRWLEERGFIEVETPMFHPLPGGALAKPFTTHHNALDVDVYLRVAPELYLKRLIVGGFERVFEIGRVFRNEGLSPRHQPEFTMLELYQAYADYHDAMQLIEELVAHLATELRGTTELTYGGREIDLTPPWRRATMFELIEEHTGLTVDLDTPIDELRRLAAERGIPAQDEWGPGKLIVELYEKTTEVQLWDPVFVCDYPKEVSPLARDHRSTPGLVERFEPIVAGRELGNAFSELTDPVDQRERFEAQAAQRAAGDEEAMTVDEDFLRALEYGLPPTAGLGIGVDRLVMLLADVATIRDVTLFPTLRPERFAGDDASGGAAGAETESGGRGESGTEGNGAPDGDGESGVEGRAGGRGPRGGEGGADTEYRDPGEGDRADVGVDNGGGEAAVTHGDDGGDT